MKKFNLIVFFIFLFGFFQLFLFYKNFYLMKKITHLEEKRNLLITKIKKEDIHLDSLSLFPYSFLDKELKIKVDSLNFSKEIIDFFEDSSLIEIAKKENGEK